MAEDSNTVVCSMCGDVGFSDKLFRCIRCVSRFQHSYCSNYYEETAEICDWCLSEERRHGPTPKKKNSIAERRSEFSSGEKVKRADRDESGSRGKGSSSSKPAGRRYKLLKDVMC